MDRASGAREFDETVANGLGRVSLSEVVAAVEDHMGSTKHRLGLPAGIHGRL